MRITISPKARQHSVTDEEMRSIVEHPEVRYPVVASFDAEADAYMYVGHIGNEPWLEVGAEQTGTESCVVFHAMLLTKAIAEKVFEVTAGQLDLRQLLVGQRAHVGPQIKPVIWPL